MMGAILFFSEDTLFKPKQKAELRKWVNNCVMAEGFKIQEINFIFCTDDYLLEINKNYLDHDTYTDIITFDNGEQNGKVLGDIFISVDRINENAAKFGVSERDELHRVMIHGVLHLLGYTDKDHKTKAQMTDRENHYLGLRNF
jgi:rRNA maturation RNase YbeY